MFYLSLTLLCHRYCFTSSDEFDSSRSNVIRRKENSLFLLRSLFIIYAYPQSYCDHCFEKKKEKKTKEKGKKSEQLAKTRFVLVIYYFSFLVLPFSPPLFADYSLTIFYISLSTYSTYLHTLFMKSIISRV